MRFKAMIIYAIICNSVLSLSAQNQYDRYHEFGSGKHLHLNVYFGPLVALSTVEGSLSIDLGATAGFIINTDFFAGLYAQKLINYPPRTDLSAIGYSTYTNGEIGMVHAGGVLGYIHKPGNVFHWGVSSSAGIGILSLYAKDPVVIRREKIYTDRVYIVIPRLFAEMNLTKWLKVNVTAGYRFLGMVNGTYTNPEGEIIPTLNKSDYSKPELSLALLFGSFGIRKGLLY